MGSVASLEVEHFAQIHQAQIEFGDLTILVGPQASGKSLLLQLWKLALDQSEIVPALRDAGDDTSSPDALLRAVLGKGMEKAWGSETLVRVNGVALEKERLGKWIRPHKPSLFFVPAHRSLLLADGWAHPFGRLDSRVPVVARLFSQALNEAFSRAGAGVDLLPRERELKREYREAIDAALFHGGVVSLRRTEASNYRLSLAFKGPVTDLAYMTWTAGQREFTPLLFALLRLLPPRKRSKVPNLDWIAIEEPEMGLHPQAIAVFMALVLELLYRGYRVILSTHSPLVLDVAWAIKRLSGLRKSRRLRPPAGSIVAGLGLENTQSMRRVAAKALGLDIRIFALTVGRGFQVRSEDISELDPSSERKAESEWGGLTEFSSNLGDAVAKAVNAAEASS